ncbi:PIG-L family deacetylase [Barnesiella sp. ET7]|uniref:PIG-L deacetylase family protein n=1 Tax=Barnesiella sp. ET7 TaxID=2972460 RepID=UPI0021AC4BE6|nr:PIG-L deacetylase family protein [Barnesiella sp. ET7]MCR8911519.1 PIG-L family deacetylase [Barnesiella sp. ET7]
MKDFIRRIRVLLFRVLFQDSSKLVMPNSVLIVAPHPDDEVLGCSGLIQRLLNEGKQVDVAILSGGGKSHAGCCKIDESTLIESRRNLSRKAAEILGLSLEHLHFLDYPDGCIAFDCSETDLLKKLIKTLQPKAIFVPHKGEGWSDHLEAGRIVRKLAGETSGVSFYEYCVWFWYYNVWNIDRKKAFVLTMTEEELSRKNEAIDAYIKPKAPCGNPWSGVLPSVFVWANRWRKELYFRIK